MIKRLSKLVMEIGFIIIIALILKSVFPGVMEIVFNVIVNLVNS